MTHPPSIPPAEPSATTPDIAQRDSHQLRHGRLGSRRGPAGAVHDVPDAVAPGRRGPHVAGERIGVDAQGRDGAVAIGLQDSTRPATTHAVRMQEEHELALAAGVLPTLHDPLA